MAKIETIIEILKHIKYNEPINTYNLIKSKVISVGKAYKYVEALKKFKYIKPGQYLILTKKGQNIVRIFNTHKSIQVFLKVCNEMPRK